MPPKPLKRPTDQQPPKRRPVTAAGNSRRLLIQRLREIDKLSAKELAQLMADAEKLRTASRKRK